ncbi:Lsr2 family protein [Lentzea sp. JNUCC 0626]|uniref:histone-like nucleoid-structuring protein Lsr2 n=1 Tax=Lentzea sp. JNUCC 0626 TaxID=3367513 RepID=UPI00374A29C7
MNIRFKAGRAGGCENRGVSRRVWRVSPKFSVFIQFFFGGRWRGDIHANWSLRLFLVGVSMGQKVIVRLIDDLDGVVCDVVETVRFGLDGVNYEMDLSPANALRLRQRFAAIVRNARRTAGRARRRGASVVSSQKVAGSEWQTRVIRDWAKANGYAIYRRGRLPKSVIDAYVASCR